MKTLTKLFVYLVAAFTILVAALLVSAYVFKDRIIKQFVDEANKSLNTPVTIGRIEVSAFQDFPRLAIVFHQVYIEDSHPQKDTLVVARKISFQLNPIEVWKGNYDVRGVRIEDSRTKLKINVAGKTNYDILKQSDGQSGSISFDLKDVDLVNTKVSYDDEESDQHDLFSSENIIASISIVDALYMITASGDVTSHQIGVGDQLFLVEKKFMANAEIDYDDEEKIVTIKPSSLELDQSFFEVTGVYSFKEENLIDLEANGKDTDIQTVLALLPEGIRDRFKDYESDGNLYFNLQVKGEMSQTQNPLFSVAFGCTGTTVFHPDYNSRITDANLEGSFATPSFADLSRADLFLKGIKGKLNGREFNADFSVQDFVDPFVNLQFKGELDAASILHFYKVPGINSMSGSIIADVSFNGKVGLLEKRSTAQQVKAGGTLVLDNLDISIGKKPVEMIALRGSLQFNNNDLALSNASGKVGRSDFKLNGLFKNSITFFLFENQPIGIEADLQSKFIDLDGLLMSLFGDERSDTYRFSISPNLYLNFNCDIQALHYKRFRPRRLKGNLLIKNQMAVSRSFSVNAMGGSLTLDGIVDAKNPTSIEVVAGCRLRDVHMDSIFYAFENFDQDFVQDKHLRGLATADINVEMVLGEKLNLVPQTLVADINTTIKNGELNNFDPLKQLSRYLDDEGLSKLRFGDLRNDIHIENKIILIPQMEVRSNVTNIQLSGTHAFDQQIDYRVVAPLRNRKKIDPDEAFGAIEQDDSGQARVFLKITGTTDDYDVSYDKQALKLKVAGDLKKEVRELREAFRLKNIKKKKELELSDEAFDW